jgi:hypothetical protein
MSLAGDGGLGEANRKASLCCIPSLYCYGCLRCCSLLAASPCGTCALASGPTEPFCPHSQGRHSPASSIPPPPVLEIESGSWLPFSDLDRSPRLLQSVLRSASGSSPPSQLFLRGTRLLLESCYSPPRCLFRCVCSELDCDSCREC